MKIIIYGINSLELRRKIENFLSKGNHIIGYTDLFLTEDIVDHRRFISLDLLNTVEFDYILVSIMSDETVAQIKHKLNSVYSIPYNKIINPVIFKSNKYFQKDLVMHIENNFSDSTKNLIFGLSYSLRGILKNKLKQTTFDFSWHGLDLFYNYNLLLYAMKRGRIKEIEKSFLVIPYYYFNYDMSCSSYQYESGQIISVHKLNLHHNREKMIEKHIDYEVCEFLFAQKYMEWYRPVENVYIHNNSIDNTKEELSNIWKNEYHDTLIENEEIYQKMIDDLLFISKKVVIVVPPFYIKGIKNIKDTKKMKMIFKKITKYRSDEVTVIDLFEDAKYQNPLYFCDATHLNLEGAKVFTKEINNIIG